MAFPETPLPATRPEMGFKVSGHANYRPWRPIPVNLTFLPGWWILGPVQVLKKAEQGFAHNAPSRGAGMDIHFALFCGFAFLSYFSAAFAGFGGVIIALTLGAHLYPIEWMLPVLLPLTALANLYLLICHHRYIDTEVLLKRILPFMGTGLAIGFSLFTRLQGELLRTLFGFMVIGIAVRELIHLIRADHRNASPLPGWVSSGFVFAAGVVHGIYASGGPLLVYAANRMQLEKSVFRSTLSIVWLIMNICLTSSYAVTGRIDAASLAHSVSLLPSLVLGVALGDFMHQRIPERTFKVAVFLLLTLSGVFITIK